MTVGSDRLDDDGQSDGPEQDPCLSICGPTVPSSLTVRGHSMRRVDGRVVVVTGAAGGQGAAEATALAEYGATVVATDVKDPLRDLGASVRFRHLDVAEPDSWRELAAWLSDEYGRVDGLVNNAGVGSRTRLEDVSLAEWDRVMRINATGALLGVQAIAAADDGGGVHRQRQLAGWPNRALHDRLYDQQVGVARLVPHCEHGARGAWYPSQLDLPCVYRFAHDRDCSNAVPCVIGQGDPARTSRFGRRRCAGGRFSDLGRFSLH